MYSPRVCAILWWLRFLNVQILATGLFKKLLKVSSKCNYNLNKFCRNMLFRFSLSANDCGTNSLIIFNVPSFYNLKYQNAINSSMLGDIFSHEKQISSYRSRDVKWTINLTQKYADLIFFKEVQWHFIALLILAPFIIFTYYI